MRAVGWADDKLEDEEGGEEGGADEGGAEGGGEGRPGGGAEQAGAAEEPKALDTAAAARTDAGTIELAPTKPAATASAWEPALTAAGERYYYNRDNGETSWEVPPEEDLVIDEEAGLELRSDDDFPRVVTNPLARAGL